MDDVDPRSDYVKRIIAAVVGLMVVSSVAVVACADDTPPAQQDLPDDKVTQDTGTRLVYVDPDEYPNLLVLCDGPTRVYMPVSASGPLPIEVVPDHPLCQR